MRYEGAPALERCFSLIRYSLVTFEVVILHGTVEVNSGIKDPIQLQGNFMGGECAWIELSV